MRRNKHGEATCLQERTKRWLIRCFLMPIRLLGRVIPVKNRVTLFSSALLGQDMRHACWSHITRKKDRVPAVAEIEHDAACVSIFIVIRVKLLRFWRSNIENPIL